MANFIPLRGKEVLLRQQTLIDGQLFVATDTGKIFFDHKDETGELVRTDVAGGGGNSGIYYANKKLTADEKLQDIVNFSVAEGVKEIEGNGIPSTDDLIINIPEGALYRVIEYLQDYNAVSAKRLTVAGGGGSSLAEDLYLKIDTEQSSKGNIVNGQDAYIYFTPIGAKKSNGQPVIGDIHIIINFYVQDGNSWIGFSEDKFDGVDGELIKYNFGKKARESASQKIVITAKQDNTDSIFTYTKEFMTTELSLRFGSNYSNIKEQPVNTASFEYFHTGSVDQIAEYYFDDMEKPIKTVEFIGDKQQSGTVLVVLADIGCNVTHGSHKLKVRLYQKVGENKGQEALPSLEWEMATFEANNSKPIIWLGTYKENYYTYETIQIPFRVYKENSGSNGIEVIFCKESYEINRQTITNTAAFSIFEIPDAEENKTNRYSIVCGEDENRVEREITFKIVQDENRPNYKIQQPEYLTYLLNTVGSGRSNTESEDSRRTLKYTRKSATGEEEIAANFEEFNWLNNGWIRDDQGKTCLRISNGAKLTIPIGPTTFKQGQSNTIEIAFKIRNVQDYDNLIKTISRYEYTIEDSEGNKTTKTDDDLYFQFYGYQYTLAEGAYNSSLIYYIKENEYTYTKANVSADNYQSGVYYLQSENQVYKTQYTNYDAFLTAYLKSHNLGIEYDDLNLKYTQKIINTDNAVCKYCSGNKDSVVGLCLGSQDAFFSTGLNTVNVSYVEDEFTTVSFIYSHINDLVFIYLNGILTSAIKYSGDSTNGFVINSSGFEFNSAHCDIDLYKIRCYNVALDVNSIVSNYAVDINDIDVYDQNVQLTALNNKINEYQLQFTRTNEGSVTKYNEEHPDKPLMPYIIFDTTYSNSGDKLVWMKGKDIQIGVEFVNAPLDAAYARGELDAPAGVTQSMTAEEKEKTVKDYYQHHSPSWIGDGINMAVQGTSSEFYPRRNYKLKTKTAYVRNGSSYEQAINKKKSDKAVKDNDAWDKANPDYIADRYHLNTTVYDSQVNILLNRGPFKADYDKDIDGLDHVKNPEYILSTAAIPVEGLTYYLDSQGEQKADAWGPDNQYKPNTFYIKNENYVKAGEEKTRQDYFYMDNNTCGTTKFTMKIDFMESSGTYNMGFANLVKNAYSKHPLDDLQSKQAIIDKKNEILLINNTDDYRTSAQGFRTMAFHKKSDGTYTYIGMYNMLIDKGSDECYGFKADKTMNDTPYQKYLPIYGLAEAYEEGAIYYADEKGKEQVKLDETSFEPNKYYVLTGYPKLPKVVECWEFENNSRTYCSYRDPLNRKDLSFDFSIDGKRALNAVGSAPRVADSFEYRYHPDSDILDYVVSPQKEADKLRSDDMVEYMRSTKKDMTVIDGDGEEAKQTLNNRCEFFLDRLKNWEKACQWVWSTCIDFVTEQGEYKEVSLGEKEYKSNTFYLLNNDNTYVKDSSETFNPDVQYYELTTNADGDSVYKKAFVYPTTFPEGIKDVNSLNDYYNYLNLYPYEINTYYTLIDGTYVLDNSGTFNVDATYYKLKNYEEKDFEGDEHHADRLVRKVNKGEVYDPTVDYYTYDGSVSYDDYKNKKYAVNKAADGLVNENNVENYYIGIQKEYGGNTYKYDTKEYRLAKFRAELTNHFDLEYMATYFVMTEVFECYDSRGKNCMMATWGPQSAGGDYIWYPIFYDIDTQLGINNTGIPSFEYNVDATIDGNFSTSDSVLWNNFYTTFKASAIIPKYRNLKGEPGTGFDPLKNPPLKSIDVIEGWYNTDPNIVGREVVDNYTDQNYMKHWAMLGERPIIAKNLDEYYKYITITNKGTQVEDPSNPSKKVWAYEIGLCGYLSSDSQGKYAVDSNYTYFYALQGDRSTSRRQFLTNRLEYIDSWLNQGNYQRGGGNHLRGRISANNSNMTSDHYLEPTDGTYFTDEVNHVKRHKFDAEYWLNLQPTHSSYVTLGDDTEAYPSKKYDGVNPLRFEVDTIKQGVRQSANYREQLLYIYGMNHMKDLGDISNLYWQEFYLQGDTHTLTSLKLGYDGVGDDPENSEWYNKNVNGFNLNAGKDASPGLPLLKELNLCNIQVNTTNGTASTSLDLTTCEKLENFRATKSNFEDFTFADGVALKTLYLPSNLKRLVLREARLLTKLIDKYQQPVYDATTNSLIAEQGLWIDDFMDNNRTQLTEIEIAGGGLGYESYRLLNQFYKITKDDISAPRQLRFTDVKWSPFTIVGEKDSYNSKRDYYIDDGHYGLIKTTNAFDSEEIQTAIANKEVYSKRKDETISSIITDIDLLEKLINGSQYISDSSSNIPNITGNIYINNDEYYSIDDNHQLNTKRNAYYTIENGNYTSIVPTSLEWAGLDKSNVRYRIKESYVRSVIQANYPKLTIFFAHIDAAYTAKYVRMDERDNTRYDSTFEIQTDTLELSENRYFVNPYKKGWAKAKDHYDFVGWSTSKNDTGANTDTGRITSEQWDAKTVNDINKDIHTYIFYAIYKPQTFTLKLSKAYRPNNTNSLKDELIFGTSMREVLLSNLDEFTTDKNPDDANGHVHHFDSSDLLLNKEKYSLLGYRLKPDSTPNSQINEWEHLYFDATKDDILFSFYEQYDAKIQGNISVMPATEIVSVYNNIYSRYEQNGNNQYYGFIQAPSNISTIKTEYWISKIRGIAGTFTNILTIPKGAYRTTNGWTIAKGIVVNVNDEGYKDKIIDDCSMIKAIFFEQPTADELKKGYGITHIGNYAFEDWTALEQIELPDTLTYIGENAFAGCKKLTSLTIGSQSKPFSSLDNIKTGAFSGTGLQMLTIYATDVGVNGYSYEAYGKNWGLKLPDDGGPQVSVEKVSL